MSKVFYTIFYFFVIILSSCNLFGCATRSDTGLVAGGIIGGVAGSALTRGSTAGTVAGAVGGALIGRGVARDSYYSYY